MGLRFPSYKIMLFEKNGYIIYIYFICKMKKTLLAGVLLLNVILIVYFIKKRQLEASPDNLNASIVMLGNSHTKIGDWNKLLQRDDVANSGMPGNNTSQFFIQLPWKVLKYKKAKICFIEGGINDIDAGIPLERVMFNYQRIVDTLKIYNIKPVLTLTFFTQKKDSTNRIINNLNQKLKTFAYNNNIDLIDINDSISENNKLKSEFASDEVHLKPNAYQYWVAEVKAILNDR